MPFIVLLQHATCGSSRGTSYCKGFSRSIALAEVALSGIPEELRLPRPIVASAPEPDAVRTAEAIAGTLHCPLGLCDALGENIVPVELSKFACLCLVAQRQMIIVSHAATIEALIGAFFAARNLPCLIGPIIRLSRHHAIAIDTDTDPMTVRLIPAPTAPPDA